MNCINKYFPRKNGSYVNPENNNCHQKCFKQFPKPGKSKKQLKGLRGCRRTCNKTYPQKIKRTSKKN